MGGGAEEALEVAGDAIGEGLDDGAIDGFAGGREETVEEFDGFGAALLGVVEFEGGGVAGLGDCEFGVGIGAAVEGEAVAGDEAEGFGFAAAVFLLLDGAGEPVKIGGEKVGGEGGELLTGGGELGGGLLFVGAGLGEGGFARWGVAVIFLEDFEAGFEVAEGLAGLGGLVAVLLESCVGGFEALAELGGMVAGGGFGFFGEVERLLEGGAELAGGG